MDIISFVVQGRDQALLYGDYSTYQTQLAKRLLSSRKKLGIVTKNRGKFQKKDLITPDDAPIGVEHVHLFILTAERAWAQAMGIKASRSAAQEDIAGRTRSHLISRLNKAAQTASKLVNALSASTSSASANDILEAKSYAALMRGAMFFEKHSWELCIESYSIARMIFSALATAGKGEQFKDLVSDTIDPSLRYAAYQLKTPRTVPIPVIAKRSFPKSEAAIAQEINRLNSVLLAEGEGPSDPSAAAETGPTTITWRSREVPIEDAQISIAWASVAAAKARLAANIAKSHDKQPQQIAAYYDEILTTTQDAVDATKQAIDELKTEGVPQSDTRMQRLQITRTAVNFEMVGWRIGRNRVLTGPRDGGPEEYSIPRRRKAKAVKEGDSADGEKKIRELPASKKSAKLKEKVALYDGSLQNLESIKELPGVAADEELVNRIGSYEKYFSALRCLSIARSHAISGNAVNALALIHRANSLIQDVSPTSSQPSNGHLEQQPLGIEVQSEAFSFLKDLIAGELQRYRALVHMHNLRNAEQQAAHEKAEPPLSERLDTYPRRVNFRNLVELPPKIRPIPAKPIFLDIAWNYIKYPGKSSSQADDPPVAPVAAASAQNDSQEEQPKKKGWFGFGR